MTREEFFEAKAQLIRTMNYTRDLSQAYNKPLASYCKEAEIKRIIIKSDADEAELREQTLNIALMMDKPGTVMTIQGHTKPNGRYDYFNYIEYIFTTQLVKGEIEEYQVIEYMKELVKRELGLGKYDHLECQVMKLFKEGTIEWDEVVKAHSQSCSL